jgi:zinc and cadmium transporter
MGLTPLSFASALVQGLDAGAASLATALLFAAFTALGMLAGVWIIRRFEPWALRHTGELIAFAAGLLVSGALLHLIPGASDLVGADRAMGWAMISFLGFYLLEAHFIPHVHARGETPIDEPLLDHHHHDDHHLGPLVVAGLGLHSVVDGLSVGASLSAGPFLGSVAALLVVAHKMPVGIAAMSALYHSGVSGGRAALVTFGLAMVTPLMVMVSYFTFRGITNDALGVLLGLAGGSFLYIGAADLLPEGQARGRPANTLMFLAGAIVMIGVKLGVH